MTENEYLLTSFYPRRKKLLLYYYCCLIIQTFFFETNYFFLYLNCGSLFLVVIDNIFQDDLFLAIYIERNLLWSGNVKTEFFVKTAI